MAIYHIKPQANDPVEQVLLGKAHYVSSWLLNGYATLITRSEPISEQESITIGLLTAIRLYLILLRSTSESHRLRTSCIHTMISHPLSISLVYSGSYFPRPQYIDCI